MFDIDGTNFQIAPGVRDDCERHRLSLSFWDQAGRRHMTERNLGDEWPAQQIEGDYACTTEGLAPIRGDGTIDLDPLHKAAADALSAIGNHLRDCSAGS